MHNTFSSRHGFAQPDPPVTIRDDAPPIIRTAAFDAALEAGLSLDHLRTIVCRQLMVTPDTRGNWGDDNIASEVRTLLEEAPWFEVYDVIEALALDLRQKHVLDPSRDTAVPASPVFETVINRALRRGGIGWQLVGGVLTYRGDEAFESSIREATGVLAAAGRPTASLELHEAIRDLSRRPTPEITGAIQHSVAALECVARDLAGGKQTLGEIVQKNRDLFPKPIDSVVEKLWGWTSNNGRHLSEGAPPAFHEAELTVGLSAVLVRYLSRKIGAEGLHAPG